MPSISDQMIYIVVVAHQGGDYLPERNVSDLDRKATVKDIADGQYEGVRQVIELNPVEHTSRDVTEDIARDVMTVWANEAEPLLDWQFEFVEQHVGFQAANSFRRAA